MRYLVLILMLPVLAMAQTNPRPPKGANLITVKGISFQQVCQQLVDMGYSIEKKDNELQTVRTEYKEYSKSWNAAYRLNVRVKDSIAYINGHYSAPWWLTEKKDRLWDDAPIWNQTKSKGETNSRGMQGYAFGKMNEFATSLKGQIEYKIEVDR